MSENFLPQDQEETAVSQESCRSADQYLQRRDFLKVTGLGMVATTAGRLPEAIAGPFDEHAGLIPPDKKLSAEWVAGLRQRGEKEVWSGADLKTIGMPCGGIGTGQLYLCGDGTLGSWQIFNNLASLWIENTGSTYSPHLEPDRAVEQGFAVVYAKPGEDPTVRPLNRTGFTDISFRGEYPLATITYRDPECPVAVVMEAGSPFIPMNADDSALPATAFNITVRNLTTEPLKVLVLGWLENAVNRSTGIHFNGHRRTRVGQADGGYSLAHHWSDSVADPEAENFTPPIVFTDFEGSDWGNWTVEGDAFGSQPVAGTAQGQQPVTGFEGEKLANSYAAGDNKIGQLISPEFTIERDFINLLVGGGNYPSGPVSQRTQVELLINDQIIASAKGTHSEALQWQSWFVSEHRGKPARIRIVDEVTIGWGHILVDQIEFSDKPRNNIPDAMERAADYGTMSLACFSLRTSDSALNKAQPEHLATTLDDGETTYALDKQGVAVLRSATHSLAPADEATETFALSWYFPNAVDGQGQYYASRFVNSAEVITYLQANYDRLLGSTRLWRDTYYDSSLPYWLLDRLHSTVSYLATGTTRWYRNGRFWAFEGVACCAGTCTHVWNYAHTHARLFPEIGRNIRIRQDLCDREHGGGFHPDSGLVGFRSDDNYAADGQCGTVLKAWREHLCSSDNKFLFRYWPRIRKVLEYSIRQDADMDGLIENSQHNTYDINYFGPNTFVGGLYLAALRAGEEMARIVGDDVFANHVRAIFETGSQATMDRLWNGEFFTQEVDLAEHPNNQYGPGCLSDQVFGQGWAHQASLGYLYPREAVLKTLESVWKYNWAPDITPYNEAHKPGRWFISPGQAGLFTCTWPKSDYLPTGTAYKNEVWTGIEYQVAGHMVWEDMLDEGLAICRAVHDRYHPGLLNPYNEVECGDHYARAMASWGVYQALAGFEYDGPRGWLKLAPKLQPEAFKAAVALAEGWGAFIQTRELDTQVNTLELRHGSVRLNELELKVPTGSSAQRAEASVEGVGPVAVTPYKGGSGLRLVFNEPLVLKSGDKLEVVIEVV